MYQKQFVHLDPASRDLRWHRHRLSSPPIPRFLGLRVVVYVGGPLSHKETQEAGPRLEAGARPVQVSTSELGVSSPIASESLMGPNMLKDCAILVLLLGVATTATFVKTARHPEQVFTDDFLFQDAGANLLLAEELAAGKVLYRDLSYIYGPVPIYLYTAAAKLFGNSATTYVEFRRSLSLLHLALVFLVLRSRFPRWPAAAVTLLGVAPFAIVPGAILGGYLCSAYMPIEALLFDVIAAAVAAAGDPLERPGRGWHLHRGVPVHQVRRWLLRRRRRLPAGSACPRHWRVPEGPVRPLATDGFVDPGGFRCGRGIPVRDCGGLAAGCRSVGRDLAGLHSPTLRDLHLRPVPMADVLEVYCVAAAQRLYWVLPTQSSGWCWPHAVEWMPSPGLTHHNSEAGLYGKFRIPNKLKLLPYSLATFR